jgi:hypothetical protein
MPKKLLHLARNEAVAGCRNLAKPDERKRSRTEELEHGKREIKALGLEEYCSVLQF